MLPFFALATASGIVAASRAGGPFGPLLAAIVVLAIVPAEIAWALAQDARSVQAREPGPRGRPAGRRRLARRHLASATTSSSRTSPSTSRRGSATARRSRKRWFPAPTRSSRCRRSTTRTSRSGAASGRSTPATTTTRSSGPGSSYACRFPRSEFEGRAFGPFLIIRTRKPTVTIARYLDDARKAELIGKSLGMGDADINFDTIHRAQVRLIVRSRSRVSS